VCLLRVHRQVSAHHVSFVPDNTLLVRKKGEICQVKEIKSYDTSVSIIMTYQQNTLKGRLEVLKFKFIAKILSIHHAYFSLSISAIDSFESHITGNRCSEEEADIIL